MIFHRTFLGSTYVSSPTQFPSQVSVGEMEPFPKTHEELNFCVFSIAIIGCEFVAELIKNHPFIILFIITFVIFHNIHGDKIE